MRRHLLAFAALAGSFVGGVAQAQTIGSAFTYQGQLQNGSTFANGQYEFAFYLFAAQTGGSAVANYGTGSNPITLDVVNGQFSTPIDFGATAFNGSDRYLEIAVRPVGSVFFIVLPRQKLTATPYALRSQTAASSDATRGITVDSNGRIWAGPNGTSYRFGINSPTQGELLELNSANTNYAILALVNSSAGGRPWAMLSTGASYSTGAGDLVFRDIGAGLDRMVLGSDGNVGIGVAAPTAKLDVAGRVKCQVLEITGGSDIAEPYSIAAAGDVAPIAGMVVCIDRDQVGKLRVSNGAYDTTVAGIVSGANGVGVGLTLTQTGTVADGELPVAAAGRVWCYVDAGANGPVKAGDLLTTSATPGHAMRAEPGKANGAILGKAMSSLESGRGMVLVLVGLQ
ncbi:MAG: hypothetical protein ACOYN0_11285 [Phycisphaerales bacterium]